MRDWKQFRPAPGSSSASEPASPGLVKKRRSDVLHPTDGEPQFEIALDVNAEQLTLLFDDAATYEQRTHHGTIDAATDHQESWRQEAYRAQASIAETFGPWSEEERLEGFRYYRKVTRLK